MKCFHHNDPDGKCAGYWVYTKYPDGEYIEITYGRPFPIETIEEDEVVFIVDYSIEPEEMIELLKITPNVFWIDHHKTAIDKYKDFEIEIAGIREIGKAGCLLTFEYLYPGKEAPYFTKLINDYDLWKFEFGEATSKFITAFSAYDFSPTHPHWNSFVSVTSHDGGNLYEWYLIDEGEIMLKYRNGWTKDYMKLGFEAELHGYRCYAVNIGKCNSQYFDSLEEQYDILIPFYFNGEYWTVSLYSKTIDVSEIAKVYGGGGHKAAAGFQCKELPFKKRGN